MFRQIQVHEDDWPLQKILWIDANVQEAEFYVTAVTYGTRTAPFLAVRVLLQLVEDEGHRYPLAVAPLTYGRYVDDICGGADSSQELIEIAEQVKGLCTAGGFPLAKWQSNSADLLNSVTPDGVSSDKYAYHESETKIIGLNWRPSSDKSIFLTTTPSTSVVSKRIILLKISQFLER